VICTLRGDLLNQYTQYGWEEAGSFVLDAKGSVLAYDVDQEIADSLCRRLDLIQGDYAAESTWTELRDTLDRYASRNAVFYMAIPPDMFPEVAKRLASVDLNRRGRIVVETPFGRDLHSAVDLNRTLHSVFAEDHIFRIDHYLGKEAVEDLLVFRFGNTLLEPVWNRNYVRSVQVTMSETIGIEGRGAFYEEVGAIRDVMQNHLLQVIALPAPHPPPGPDSGYQQDETAKVINA
jgi:glucose-6-phosphate 1-dehydrogenase